MTYTDDELEAAKDFLRRRIDSELSMKRDVEDLLGEYAEALLLLLFRDALLAYLLGERGGDTLEGRIDKRCHTFFNEVAAVFLAGRLLGGYSVSDLAAAVRENMKHPWDNPVLVEVRERIASGDIAGSLDDFAEPHFGSGVEISSMGALQTLTAFAVADAWMWFGYEDARARGAKGYYVVRGSSYPCDECDSHTGIFYPIGDDDDRQQYHLNCRCMVVYSYAERL